MVGGIVGWLSAYALAGVLLIVLFYFVSLCVRILYSIWISACVL